MSNKNYKKTPKTGEHVTVKPEESTCVPKFILFYLLKGVGGVQ